MTLGHVYYLLKEKLSKEAIGNITYAIETRIFKPMNLSFNNDAWTKNKQSWETGGNNWNPVCWNGVTLAALTVQSNQAQRDLFVNKSFINSQNFLRGFTQDGFYTEGKLNFSKSMF